VTAAAEAEAAARAAIAGHLVVLPTDTVYGLGGRPDDAAATGRIFEAKQRPSTMTLPVLVPSPQEAAAIGELGEGGRRLAQRFWPGPLTVVCRRSGASSGWGLGGDPDTIGIRMPAHRLTLQVLERAGPLAVTSANRSGEPTPATCEEVRALFADAVAYYLCDEEPLAGRPSTVVDLSGREPRILREGSVASDAVLAVL